MGFDTQSGGRDAVYASERTPLTAKQLLFMFTNCSQMVSDEQREIETRIGPNGAFRLLATGTADTESSPSLETIRRWQYLDGLRVAYNTARDLIVDLANTEI